LAKLLVKHQAYISCESENNDSYQTTNSMVIRIISTDFDSLLNEICDGGYLVHSKTSEKKACLKIERTLNFNTFVRF
jgi:hypothetical protein